MMDTRLGKPAAARARESRVGVANRKTVVAAAGVIDGSVVCKSIASSHAQSAAVQPVFARLDQYIARAYSVGVETLLKCVAHGFTFKEIPITFVNRRLGQSKADLHVLVEYPQSIAKLWLHKMQGGIR